METFIVVQFDYNSNIGNKGGTKYTQLLMAFLASVKINCPDAKVIPRRIKPPTIIRYHWVSSNTKKLEVWLNEIEKCEDENIILIDCDMMVLRDPSEVFKRDFDIAYTIRGTGGIPVNGGVIFVKKNQRSIDFFKLFKQINDKMVVDAGFHQVWRTKYAGMNQAAFGYLLENKQLYEANMIPVPCNPYNICKNDWLRVNDQSCIVHVKSDLRRAVLETRVSPQYGRYKKLRDMWLKFYEASRRMPVPPICNEYGNTIDLSAVNKTAMPTGAPVKIQGVRGNEAVHPAFSNKTAKRVYLP